MSSSTATLPHSTITRTSRRRCDRGRGPARFVIPVAQRRRPTSRARAVHLTRRGRVLVVAVIAGLLLAAFAVGRSGSQAVADPRPAAGAAPVSIPVAQRTTVQRGDTLWGIAQRVAPDRDPREVVLQLRRLNDLPSGGLQAGQQLLVPVAA